MTGFFLLTNVSDLRKFIMSILAATEQLKGFIVCVCRKRDDADYLCYLSSPYTDVKISIAGLNMDITFMLDWNYLSSVIDELNELGLSPKSECLPVSIEIFDTRITIEIKKTFPIGEVRLINEIPNENYQKRGRIVRQGNKPV